MVSLRIITAGTVALLAVFALARRGPESLCALRDGKWAANEDRCVTRACYEDRSCGDWANPAAGCPRLARGDSRREVYFQLGMPSANRGDIASWHKGKGEGGEVSARFSGDKLETLQCE